MIKLYATNNLFKLQDQLGNFHNNLQELIARVMTESLDSVKNELTINFGGAIDYAVFSIDYDGEKFSLNISDLNEFVLMNESDASAQDVLDYATEMLSRIVSDELARAQLLGGI